MRERLVVIDDQISPALVQELCGKKIETWRIEDGACVPDRSPIHTRSHGTVCAALAGEFLPELELVGISTGGNGGAQVENVCAALEWCLQDGAAVVCMSMGVTCGLDLARMGTAARALRQAGCWVFCASSNGGKLIFPAAYRGQVRPYRPGGAAGGSPVGVRCGGGAVSVPGAGQAGGGGAFLSC